MGEAAERMSLASIKTGRLKKPPRVLLYGIDKIGKSTFGSKAPKPVFLGPEDGSSELDVARFPEPESWADVRIGLRRLTEESHSFQTLVLDTLDWLEPMCWEQVCKDKGLSDIEEPGFGKGYTAALDLWRVLVADLEKLRRAKNMGVILLAHSAVKEFKNPEGENYDRYQLKLQKDAAGFFREWVDALLFATHEVQAVKKNAKNKNEKAKGIDIGSRVIKTQRRAAYDAGNRYGLPEMIPLDWDAFAAGIAAHDPIAAQKIRDEIRRMTENPALPGDVYNAVAESVSESGDDLGELNRIKTKLEAVLNGLDPKKEGA